MSQTGSNQQIYFTVSLPEGVSATAVKAIFSRSGTSRTVELVDDGTIFIDAPGDGTWTGVDSGSFVRELTTRITLHDQANTEHVLFSGVVYTPDQRASHLSFQVVELGGQLRCHQVAGTWPGSPLANQEGQNFYAGAGWMMVLTVLVASMVKVLRRERMGW